MTNPSFPGVAFSITRQAAASVIDKMSEPRFRKLVLYAASTGNDVGVFASLSAGDVLEGFEQFFPGFIPFPNILDCGVALESEATTTTVLEAPPGTHAVLANGWENGPAADDVQVLSALQGGQSKPFFGGAAEPAVGLTVDSTDFSGLCPYHQGRYGDGSVVPPGPYARSDYPPIPAVRVAVPGKGIHWAGWVNDGYFVVGKRPGEVARSVIDARGEGLAEPPSSGFYAFLVGGALVPVDGAAMVPSAGKWDPDPGYPPGYYLTVVSGYHAHGGTGVRRGDAHRRFPKYQDG